MDRPRRAATKVTDFRRYHLSGDLDQEVRGLVDSRVEQFEMSLTTEQLKQQLDEEREASKKLQEDLEQMKIQNELQNKKRKQEQWQKAYSKLKEARERAEQEHEKCMEEMDTLTEEAHSESLQWLKDQMGQLKPHKDTATQEQSRKEEEARLASIQELRMQQEEISKKLAELEKGTPAAPETVSSVLRQALGQEDTAARSQGVLLEQLKAALASKKEEDPNKAMLRALLTQQNKIPGEGGTNTLKNTMLTKLMQGDSTNMAEWLANFNRQEEGESTFNRFPFLGEEDMGGRQVKTRSGILDKATTNIQQKQIWPQQNLGEDWADEDVEFKQLRFEHMVAGETRTIETCSNPAEILGRLRLQLLRRLAYLKLRGYEWNLIRKMYAAILTTIETKEYSWESNFDRFETILYRKVAVDNRNRPQHNETRPDNSEGQKRYCGDYNKPEGCPKNSPHPAWLGSGQNTTKRMVYHCCAVCLVKDRQLREHPEGHPDCPHPRD